MGRELPIFTPPGSGHGHAAREPLTIAMGGGSFDGAGDGRLAAAASAPRVDPRQASRRAPTTTTSRA